MPICSSLRRTAQSKAMSKWYCEQPGKADGLWCKRTSLIEKLQKLPAASEERKSITSEVKGHDRVEWDGIGLSGMRRAKD